MCENAAYHVGPSFSLLFIYIISLRRDNTYILCLIWLLMNAAFCLPQSQVKPGRLTCMALVLSLSTFYIWCFQYFSCFAFPTVSVLNWAKYPVWANTLYFNNNNNSCYYKMSIYWALTIWQQFMCTMSLPNLFHCAGFFPAPRMLMSLIVDLLNPNLSFRSLLPDSFSWGLPKLPHGIVNCSFLAYISCKLSIQL